VPDLDAAAEQLTRAGAELLRSPGQGPPQYRWQHFRAPDGCVYELVEYRSRPAPRQSAGPLGISRLAWVGTRTAAYEATCRFFRQSLCLEPAEETAGLSEYRLADGSVVEVIRPGSALDHPHFTTGPVVGFAVPDVAAATGHLRAAGTEILLEQPAAGGGWSHFRAPDGNVYEVKQVH
jgi:catechol 2,3-dioxygenase-like lactoylglutathione lyase family enzyme